VSHWKLLLLEARCILHGQGTPTHFNDLKENREKKKSNISYRNTFDLCAQMDSYEKKKQSWLKYWTEKNNKSIDFHSREMRANIETIYIGIPRLALYFDIIRIFLSVICFVPA
jgi:hypothetical protein